MKDGHRFILVYNGIVTKVTCHKDSDAASLIEAFRKYMLACGYHPTTVAEFLGED